MIEVASIVVGFLDPDDIKKLMMTCKQIHADDSIKKVCIDKLTEQYTRRLYPVDGGAYRIRTSDDPQVPRTFRIHTRFGYRVANLYLGAPEFQQIDTPIFNIHHENVIYTFYMPLASFAEDGRVSEVPVASLVDDAFLRTVRGISFRELSVSRQSFTMRATLIVVRAHHPALTLRIESRWAGIVNFFCP